MQSQSQNVQSYFSNQFNARGIDLSKFRPVYNEQRMSGVENNNQNMNDLSKSQYQSDQRVQSLNMNVKQNLNRKFNGVGSSFNGFILQNEAKPPKRRKIGN